MTSHGEVVQYLAPTSAFPECAEWKVDGFTVATTPASREAVVLLVPVIGRAPIEVPVPDPERLARALLAARKGEW